MVGGGDVSGGPRRRSCAPESDERACAAGEGVRERGLGFGEEVAKGAVGRAGDGGLRDLLA